MGESTQEDAESFYKSWKSRETQTKTSLEDKTKELHSIRSQFAPIMESVKEIDKKKRGEKSFFKRLTKTFTTKAITTIPELPTMRQVQTLPATYRSSASSECCKTQNIPPTLFFPVVKKFCFDRF